MDWEAIGAIGEVIGAVAVVATLLYLGTQVRQSIRVSQAEAQRSVNDTFSVLAIEVAKSPELRTLWRRLPELRSVDELDADEHVMLEMLLRALFNTVDHGFGSMQLGFSATGAAELSWLRNRMLALPVVREWWKVSPRADGSFAPAFVERVDQIVAELDAEASS